MASCAELVAFVTLPVCLGIVRPLVVGDGGRPLTVCDDFRTLSDRCVVRPRAARGVACPCAAQSVVVCSRVVGPRTAQRGAGLCVVLRRTGCGGHVHPVRLCSVFQMHSEYGFVGSYVSNAPLGFRCGVVCGLVGMRAAGGVFHWPDDD